MTFLEWLHMEYHEPEPSDNYHERDLIAAWNQAVALCRYIVSEGLQNYDEEGPTEIYNKLNSVFERGPDDGH